MAKYLNFRKNSTNYSIPLYATGTGTALSPCKYINVRIGGQNYRAFLYKYSLFNNTSAAGLGTYRLYVYVENDIWVAGPAYAYSTEALSNSSASPTKIPDSGVSFTYNGKSFSPYCVVTSICGGGAAGSQGGGGGGGGGGITEVISGVVVNGPGGGGGGGGGGGCGDAAYANSFETGYGITAVNTKYTLAAGDSLYYTVGAAGTCSYYKNGKYPAANNTNGTSGTGGNTGGNGGRTVLYKNSSILAQSTRGSNSYTYCSYGGGGGTSGVWSTTTTSTTGGTGGNGGYTRIYNLPKYRGDNGSKATGSTGAGGGSGGSTYTPIGYGAYGGSGGAGGAGTSGASPGGYVAGVTWMHGTAGNPGQSGYFTGYAAWLTIVAASA